MKTGEKKLGCLAGTVRTNQPWVGTIEGSVNNATMPKGGKKQVSIDKEGNVLFWIVNDFDVTVLPEDVVGCELVRNGIYVHGGPSIKRGETNIRTNWFGPMLKLSFADGTEGILCVKAFRVEQNVYKPGFGDLPRVTGWLTPDGKRDEHFGDAICPEGYIPNVDGYYKSVRDTNQLKNIDKALKLSARFPEAFESEGVTKGLYTFEGGRSTFYVFSLSE